MSSTLLSPADLNFAGVAGMAEAERPAAAAYLAFSTFLISQPTATRALELWRQERGYGVAPVRAVLLSRVVMINAGSRLSANLNLKSGEDVYERQVALEHTGVRLAVATNWFVPGRLPGAIADALMSGDVPFGRLIAPLGGFREHMPAQVNIAATRLVHRAIVCLGDRSRVAEVEEQFLPAVLERAAA